MLCLILLLVMSYLRGLSLLFAYLLAVDDSFFVYAFIVEQARTAVVVAVMVNNISHCDNDIALVSVARATAISLEFSLGTPKFA